MRQERIRAVDVWRGGSSRNDCIFINTDPSEGGMRGLEVARVLLFFSFRADGKVYPCALIRWYSKIGNTPDEATGMWRVTPDSNWDGSPSLAVVHLDTIVRAAHLLGAYGPDAIQRNITFETSLDSFQSYYVNKYIDHHAFEIAY